MKYYLCISSLVIYIGNVIEPYFIFNGPKKFYQNTLDSLVDIPDCYIKCNNEKNIILKIL